MRKIQERTQKHNGKKGGAQGQRDGYIGVETQTWALGAEIRDQIPSTKLTDLGDPSPVTRSPDRAELVLRAGCLHQLPPTTCLAQGWEKTTQQEPWGWG